MKAITSSEVPGTIRTRRRLTGLPKIRAAAGMILVLALLTGCVVPGYAPLLNRPELSSKVQKHRLESGGLERRYLLYVPEQLAESPPLVIVLHGSLQTGGAMRVSTGYEFDRLADEHGFVVAYPNGTGRHWNDCRQRASYAARRRGVDDAGFVLSLIDRLEADLRIDRRQVFVVGYSNGGHMAFRLALEAPEQITAVAAVAANLPTEENCDCKPSDRPVPVMIMNGTSDPINPYRGGTVSLFGLASRGAVFSARDSAEYFAGVNGHEGEPVLMAQESPGQALSDRAERLTWRDPGKPEVLLVTVRGGGHVVPQSRYIAPLFMGKTTRQINGPEEIWRFFSRQAPLPCLKDAP